MNTIRAVIKLIVIRLIKIWYNESNDGNGHEYGNNYESVCNDIITINFKDYIYDNMVMFPTVS